MKSKKIYVVLINYNSSSDTIECLESLLKTTYDNLQVIVVDNSETKEPMSVLLDWASGRITTVETFFENLVYPLVNKPLDVVFVSNEDLESNSFNQKIIFVKANENKGFAAANNIAFKYIIANGDEDSYIWILNNDTVIEKNVPEDIISKVIKDQDANHKVVYGTPLIEYSKPDRIQAIGGFYNKKTGLTYNLGENSLLAARNFDFERSNLVDFPVGASIIVHKQFLREIGLMCEDYFLYFEELDWALRAKEKGGWVKILNVFGVYHKQGGSTKTKNNLKKTDFIDLVFLNSRILFAKKFNPENINKIYFSILTLTIGKRIFEGNFKRIPKIIKMVFRKTI